MGFREICEIKEIKPEKEFNAIENCKINQKEMEELMKIAKEAWFITKKDEK